MKKKLLRIIVLMTMVLTVSNLNQINAAPVVENDFTTWYTVNAGTQTIFLSNEIDAIEGDSIAIYIPDANPTYWSNSLTVKLYDSSSTNIGNIPFDNYKMGKTFIEYITLSQTSYIVIEVVTCPDCYSAALFNELQANTFIINYGNDANLGAIFDPDAIYQQGYDDGVQWSSDTYDSVVDVNQDGYDDSSYNYGYSIGYTAGAEFDPLKWLWSVFWGIGAIFGIEFIPDISIGSVALFMIIFTVLPTVLGFVFMNKSR